MCPAPVSRSEEKRPHANLANPPFFSSPMSYAKRLNASVETVFFFPSFFFKSHFLSKGGMEAEIGEDRPAGKWNSLAGSPRTTGGQELWHRLG